MQNWRLLLTGPAEAQTNMAIDEAIALACRNGQVPTTLRFYTWKPAALSIGYFQKAESEIHLDRCRKQGYGFVRRLTGGKAVLHDQEFTYSLVSRTDNPLFPKDLYGSFLVFANALVYGLGNFGVHAQVFGSRGSGETAKSRESAPACFGMSRGFEVGVDGKKLIGSAQRRWKEAFLQHGSILCHFDPDQILSLLVFPNESDRKQTRTEMLENVTSLNSIHRKEIDLDLLKKSLIKGIEETFQIKLIPSSLTSLEQELAHRLAKEKYGNDDWNLGR